SYVYDGKTTNVFLKTENYYGSLASPPTLRETIDVVQRNVDLPLLDVVFVAMGGQLDAKIYDAGIAGTSSVEGVPCDHVAFRGPKVDWQIWVEQGNRPLLRKIVITTTDDPTRPQYSALMNWDLTTPLREDQFKFNPPPNAMRMSFGSAMSE